MTRDPAIPAFALYGEADPFPDVLHVETLEARAPQHDWRIEPHRHGQMAQLFVFGRGRISARVDDWQLSLADGSYVFVPELSVHEFTFEPQTEGRVFSFPLGTLRSVGPNAEEMLALLARPLAGAAEGGLLRAADALAEAAAGAGAFRAQRVVALAHALLVELAERSVAVAEAPLPGRMQALNALIAEHMGAGWSARDFATRLNVTVGHLSRLTRAATGQGAAAYIEGRVMAEAARLLAFTQLPVAEIGYRLGYADPSYFTKRFRKAQGEAPSDYRARFVG